MDWFEQITGFPEASYAQTQSRLSVIDGALVSPHSPRRPKVGQLETPSLAELRARTGHDGTLEDVFLALVNPGSVAAGS